MNLTEKHYEKLNSSGITSRAVAEQLGIGQIAAVKLLKQAGAHHYRHGLYLLPNYERLIAGQKRLARFILPYKKGVA